MMSISMLMAATVVAATLPFLALGAWVQDFNDDFSGPAGSPPNPAVWTPENGPGLYNNEVSRTTNL